MIKASRLLTNALLTVVVLRVWHILILRLFLDRPLVLAGWLSALLLLAVLGRVLAQRVPTERRSLSDRLWMRLDGPGLTFLASFLFLVFLFHWGFERAASDGREYFVQVRSLVIDYDLDFRNENASFGVRGTAMQYPFGGPLLWAPFFLFCHLWLGLLNALGGHFSRDGYSNSYQMAIGVGSLVYGFASLLLVYRVVADYFSRKLATVTTLALCIGTFIIWYLTVENSMVHGASMFVTTLFLFLWYRTRSGRTRLQWLLLGASAGLMAMVRWQDVLFLIVPMLDALAQSWQSEAGPSRLRRVFTDAAIFGVGLLAAFSPQLVFWKVVRGAWLSPPTGEHGVHLGSLHIADVLFSPNHGLLSWTPLLYLALLGLPLFFRRDRVLFAVLVVGFLAQVYINSAVEVWWGGSGFGARRFANCALVFGIGLASTLDWARRRPMAAPALVVGVLIAANVVFMLDMDDGRLPSGEGITFEQMFDSVYARVGNPFSFPENAIVGWTYRVGWPFYDRQRGRTYNNLTIDLGESDDEQFLGRGWSTRERSPRFSFRWATGPESTLVVPLREPAEYRLDMRCGPFTYAGAPGPQAVTVLINGADIGSVVMDNGMAVYPIHLPSRVLRQDFNEVLFRYRYAMSPSAVGLPADSRQLAMQCDALQLTRLLTDAP